MSERRDMNGRTEAEIRASMLHAQRVYEIARAWPDRDGKKFNRARANFEVDERHLARVRGERITQIDGEDIRPNLSGKALTDWRAGLLLRGRAGIRK